jgi:hypothetical protein
VPLDHPEQAAVIPGARIFTGLDRRRNARSLCAPASTRRPRRADVRRRLANRVAIRVRTGPRNCHDVTAYPAMHLLAAACSSHSIMVDISNPEKPVRRPPDRHQQLPGPHTAGSATMARRSS